MEKRPGLSPYHYVQNNPLIRYDPDGRIDFLKLFGLSTNQPVVNPMENYKTSGTAIEHVHEFVGEANNVIATQQQELNKTIDASIDVVQEVTIQTTAVVAPVAETTSYGLSFIAPFSGPAAPEMLAVAAGFKAIAITAKTVNTAAGGNNFTLTDIAGDLTSIGLSIAIPGAQGLTGAITGEVADRIIDGFEKKKEE